MVIKVPLDTELHAAIIRDAARHLRPADLHIAAILRQALNLEFPLPELKKPASGANAAGRGMPTNQGILNDGTQR
jgi:hypothetical protein